MLKVTIESAENYGDKPTWPPVHHASVLTAEDVSKAVLTALTREIDHVVLYSNSQKIMGYLESAALLYEEEISVQDKR